MKKNAFLAKYFEINTIQFIFYIYNQNDNYRI